MNWVIKFHLVFLGFMLFLVSCYGFDMVDHFSEREIVIDRYRAMTAEEIRIKLNAVANDVKRNDYSSLIKKEELLLVLACRGGKTEKGYFFLCLRTLI